MIVSLGSNCSVTYHLNRLNKRTLAYPFDWSSITLNQLNKVLENNFIGYEDVKIKKLSNRHLHYDTDTASLLVTNSYNISFAHEILNESSISDFSESLKRRIERFKKLVNPTFIRIETNNLSEIQMLGYDRLINNLDLIFEEYTLIVISKIKPKSNKIIYYELKEYSSDWKYSDVDWNKIFNTVYE